MVERSRKPGIGGVTRATATPKLTFVSIILGMAGGAVGREGGKGCIDVAFGTWQPDMGTSQWELGK
jgi:hypothetical protein